MTALAILATPLVLAAFVILARAVRAGRIELEGERRRVEAMDERRAAANLYAEHHLDVAPQQPPQP
jgi:hypothetical protein